MLTFNSIGQYSLNLWLLKISVVHKIFVWVRPYTTHAHTHTICASIHYKPLAQTPCAHTYA